jgi:hypothetical protein
MKNIIIIAILIFMVTCSISGEETPNDFGPWLIYSAENEVTIVFASKSNDFKSVYIYVDSFTYRLPMNIIDKNSQDESSKIPYSFYYAKASKLLAGKKYYYTIYSVPQSEVNNEEHICNSLDSSIAIVPFDILHLDPYECVQGDNPLFISPSTQLSFYYRNMVHIKPTNNTIVKLNDVYISYEKPDSFLNYSAFFYAPPAKGAPVRLFVVSDWQDYNSEDTISNNILNTEFNNDLSDFKTNDVARLIIFSGDFGWEGDYVHYKLEKFLSLNKPSLKLFSRIPIFMARGNHDFDAYPQSILERYEFVKLFPYNFVSFFKIDNGEYFPYFIHSLKFGCVELYATDLQLESKYLNKASQTTWLNNMVTQSDRKWQIKVDHEDSSLIDGRSFMISVIGHIAGGSEYTIKTNNTFTISSAHPEWFYLYNCGCCFFKGAIFHYRTLDLNNDGEITEKRYKKIEANEFEVTTDISDFDGLQDICSKTKSAKVDSTTLIENAKSQLEITSTSIKRNDLQIFPNPFNKTLTIKGLEKEAQIDIKNIAGNSVYIRYLKSSQAVIDLTALPIGMFIVTVINNQSVYIQKVIKQ